MRIFIKASIGALFACISATHSVDANDLGNLCEHRDLPAAQIAGSKQVLFRAAVRLVKQAPRGSITQKNAARAVIDTVTTILALPMPNKDNIAHCFRRYIEDLIDIYPIYRDHGSRQEQITLIRKSSIIAAWAINFETASTVAFIQMLPIIAVRPIDNSSYIDAINVVGQVYCNDWSGTYWCRKGHAHTIIEGFFAASYTISMLRDNISLMLLEDAKNYVDNNNVSDTLRLRVLIRLAGAYVEYGYIDRALLIAEAINESNFIKHAHVSDVARYYRLRAELADFNSENSEVTRYIAALLNVASGQKLNLPENDRSQSSIDNISHIVDPIVERVLRKRICFDCSLEVFKSVEKWVQARLSPSKSGYVSRIDFFRYSMLPKELLVQTKIDELTRSIVRHDPQRFDAARSVLPKSISNYGVIRALSIMDKAHTRDQVLNATAFLVERDLTKKRLLWKEYLKEQDESHFGFLRGVLEDLDQVARNLAFAGYLIASRVVLHDIAERLNRGSDFFGSRSQPLSTPKRRVVFWSSVYARLGSLGVYSKDWNAANDALDLGSQIVKARLNDEWTNGGERVAGLVHQLRPALRLIAQTRIDVAVALPPSSQSALTAQGKAFEELQYAMMGETALGLQASLRRRIATDPRLAAAIVARDHGLQQIERIEEFDAAVGRLDERARVAELNKIKATVDDARRKVQELLPAAETLASISPLPISETQALLKDSEALLILHVGSDAIYGAFVTRAGAPFTWRRSIASSELQLRIRNIRIGLDVKESYPKFPMKEAHELFQVVLGPLEDQLTKVRDLLLVVDGPLTSLPLSALPRKMPTSLPDQPAEFRAIEIDWLGLSHSITYLPTVRALSVRREPKLVSQAPNAFAGIGNPVLLGPTNKARRVDFANLFTRKALADISILREAAPLPETESEIRTLARYLGAKEDDLLLRERANEAVVRAKDLSAYRIIMFATHGVISGELKGTTEPGLVLTPPDVATAENDGLLTASEIMSMKLDADLVILSACNTAASDGRPKAEGFSGLTRSFLSAGARSVVATHWYIPSGPAVEVTTRMIEERQRSPTISWAEALRRSFTHVVKTAGSPEFAHPSSWAAFTVVGAEISR